MKTLQELGSWGLDLGRALIGLVGVLLCGMARGLESVGRFLSEASEYTDCAMLDEPEPETSHTISSESSGIVRQLVTVGVTDATMTGDERAAFCAQQASRVADELRKVSKFGDGEDEPGPLVHPGLAAG